MKPRKFTVSPKAVTASRDTVSSGTDDHRTNSRLLIGTDVEATLGYAIDGLINIFTSKLEQSADNVSFANKNLRDIQYFVSIMEDCMPDDLTDYKTARRDMIQSNDVVGGSNKIQSFMCPKCHNKTVYDADRDVYRLLDIDHGDLFICDECGSEFEGSLSFDNTVDLQPIEEDE